MEIQGVINAINNFRLYLNKNFTLRTDCENIVKYINNQNSKRQPKTPVEFSKCNTRHGL